MSATKRKARRIVLRSTTKPSPRKAPEHIVVEIFADGFIQVYGGDNLRVHIFNRLHLTNPEMANDLDEFHSLDMPLPYRRLYFPRHLRATGLVEKRTIENEYLRRKKLKALREFQRMAEDVKKGDRTK